MFGKAYAWVKRLAEIASIIQLAGSLGGAAVLAILAPALLQSALNLPTILQVALGIGVFFVALAIILAILKALLERPSGSSKARDKDGSEQDKIRAQERERQELLSRIAQRDREIERLQEENRTLTADRNVLRDEIEQAAQIQEDQLTDEQLKERCLELSRDLFSFADERDEVDPRKNPQAQGRWAQGKEQNDHDDETRELYRRRYAGRVTAYLDEAEKRAWIVAGKRKMLEDNIRTSLLRIQPPTAHIREMAQYLESFGRRF